MGSQHHNMSPSVGSASFSELWSTDLMLLILFLAILYFLITGPLHNRFTNSTPATLKQKSLFVFALILFYTAEGSPISYFGHYYLFSLHMTQQSLLYFALPPVALLAIPEWLLVKAFQPKLFKSILGFSTQPILASLVFNTLFSFYHIPFIFDLIAGNYQWMMVYHLILVLTAFTMWWPIVNPLSDKQQLSGIKKLAYIFANGVLITPACALIIFATDPLYNHYIHAPKLFTNLDPSTDQRLGGIIMKLVQELVYGSVLAYVFYNWYRQEKQEDLSMEQQTSSPAGK